MRMLAFSSRNAKEMFRDPLTVGFGLGFPLVLLLLMTLIQSNIPVELFVIDKLSGGVCVFGLCFLSLFGATLLSRDRESAFLQRLYTTPMTASDFLLGYALPMLPIALLQCVICYGVALLLKLPITIGLLFAILCILPISLLFIALGILCGCLFTQKQVGAVCGAILTNVAAWLSGIWFDLDLVGGAFRAIADALPFVHAVNLQRNLLNQNFEGFWLDLLFVLGYAVVLFVIAVIVFLQKKKKS